MKISIPFVGLILILVVLSYLESPYSVINEDHVRVSSIPYEVAMAERNEPVSGGQAADQAEKAGESDDIAPQNYSLDMLLEKKSVVNDYVVETYREYEIYKDTHGKVIKKVPTSHYDYLRYKK